MAAGRQIILQIFSICIFFSIASSQKSVVELDEDNWTHMLENEWMVEL